MNDPVAIDNSQRHPIHCQEWGFIGFRLWPNEALAALFLPRCDYRSPPMVREISSNIMCLSSISLAYDYPCSRRPSSTNECKLTYVALSGEEAAWSTDFNLSTWVLLIQRMHRQTVKHQVMPEFTTPPDVILCNIISNGVFSWIGT